MRAPAWMIWLLGAALVACSGRPLAPAPAPAADDTADEDDAGADEPALDAGPVVVDAPERSRPPSTASYEEALSVPEALNVNDGHVHLTDLQLTNPARGVLNGCRVPPAAKVTVKTVVQEGRATGVTVLVRFDKPKSGKPAPRTTPKAAKAQAKRLAKVATCVDRAVRLVVWPPSRRRDSFTMEF